MNHKSLTVIVAAFEGSEKLKNFLPSIVEAYKNYEGKKEFIVTCRVGSQKTQQFLTENYPFIEIAKSPDKNNISSALNLACKNARSEILFFVTSPVWLDKNYFSCFSGYFSSNEIFGLTGSGFDIKNGRQVYGLKKGVFTCGFMRFTDIADENIKSTPGSLKSFGMQKDCFFVNAEKFFELGGFDKVYLPFFATNDLAYRAISKGLSVLYLASLKSNHKISDLSLIEEVSFAKDSIVFVWKNITSVKYIKRHILFLCLRILTLDLFYWFGLIKAWKLYKRVTKTTKPVFCGEQILEFFKNYFSAIEKI